MTDQPSYVTRDEFERRMRALEGEVEGEKAVTRHVLEQARLNGDDLATMKAQLAHVADDVVLVKAALNTHGTRLNVLTQDAAMIRHEVTALRSDVTTLQRDMSRVRDDVAVIRAAVAPRDAPGT